MKRTPIKKIGKKGREWVNARRAELKRLVATGEYVVIKTLLYGHCKDCGRYRCLDLDHDDGRGGDDPHRSKNLDPICRECHIKRHNNMADDKKNNKNSKSKKAFWEKEHQCINCKCITSMLICHVCGKMSIKI